MIKGIFEEVTNYFRRTQDAVEEKVSDRVVDFRIENIPEIRFRFELYEEVAYIKFVMVLDEFRWKTVWDFSIVTDHWTAEKINMTVSAAMRAVDFMAYMYRR